jgi:prepilin-type N-terminal cleavage/methylation domain-containing protein
MFKNLQLRGRRSRRGFTIVELLVVMAVISILAGLLMPAILRSMTHANTVQCIANLRQIGQGFTQYTSHWESWLICAGNSATEHDLQAPILEDAWITPWVYRADFPYWYEALMDFVSPGLTPEYMEREYEEYFNSEWPTLLETDVEQEVGDWGSYDPDSGEPPDPGDTPTPPPSVDPQVSTMIKGIRFIKAKCSPVFSCPEFKESVIGYGYNYVAPFGNPSCYGKYGLVKHFKWKTRTKGTFNYPVRYYDGKMWMIPLLWFGRSAHFGVLSTPSQQILICDTGFIVNAYKDRYLTAPRHPSEWVEIVEDYTEAYVRFPLSNATINGPRYKLRRYRPMPRHGGRVACVMFDGSCQALPINEVIGAQWGDVNCWYDNIPPTKPPVSPLSERAEQLDPNPDL